MKKVKLFVITLLTCLFGCLYGVSAAAATPYQSVPYSETRQKVGKVYVWQEQTGALYACTTKNGIAKMVAYGNVSAITNGKYIYYKKDNADSMDVYRYTIKSGALNKVVTLEHGESIIGIYNNKLYFSRHDVSEMWNECDGTCIHTCSYNLKTKKVKTVLKNISVRYITGKYLIGRPNSGALVDLPLKIYNMKTGKTKTLTESSIGYQKVGKYIYYAHAVRSIKGGWMTKIYKYNITTGKKKCVAKSIQTQGIREFTNNYIKYISTNGSENIKYY